MRFVFFLLFIATAIGLTSNLQAQHNDIEFGYDDVGSPTELLLSPQAFNATTSEGLNLIRSNMESLDPFNPADIAADQPGFTTHPEAGLIANPGDRIMINALDASQHSMFGVGLVNYYNPQSGRLEATGRIAFEDNTATTQDLVLNGRAIESGINPQFIGAANRTGSVHDHITWNLLDDDSAPLGAYGLLVQLQSDFSSLEESISLFSDPFWLVFNHGLSNDQFENSALPRFGIRAVPEPGSSALIGLAVCVVASQRRRSKAG